MKISRLLKTHQHVWQMLADPAIGLYAKRECPGGNYEFVGRAEVCHCGMARFVPEDLRLWPVEIDVSESKR